MPCILTALQQDRCLQFPVFSWLLAGPPGNVYRPFQQLKARKIEGLGDSSPAAAATAAKLLQSCLTLCNPIDGSPPGSPVPGKNTGVGCHFLLQCMKVKSITTEKYSISIVPQSYLLGHQAPATLSHSRRGRQHILLAVLCTHWMTVFPTLGISFLGSSG